MAKTGRGIWGKGDLLLYRLHLDKKNYISDMWQKRGALYGEKGNLLLYRLHLEKKD